MLFHNVLRNLFAHSTSRLVYFDKPQYRQAEHFAGIGEKAATIEDADMTELEKLGVVTYEKPHENAQGLVAFLMEQMKEKTDLSEKKRLAIALNFASIISLHFDPHSMRKDDKIEFDIDSAGIGCKASVNGTDYEIDLSQTYRDIDPSTLTQVSDATRDSLKGTAAEVLAKARIPYDAIVSVRGKFSWDQYKKDFQALQRLGLADASHDASLIKKDVQDGGGADLAKLRKIGTEFLKAVKKLANDEGGDLGKVKAKLDTPAPAAERSLSPEEVFMKNLESGATSPADLIKRRETYNKLVSKVGRFGGGRVELAHDAGNLWISLDGAPNRLVTIGNDGKTIAIGKTDGSVAEIDLDALPAGAAAFSTKLIELAGE